MREKHYENALVQTEILDFMICNCCGKRVETQRRYNDTDINDVSIEFKNGSVNNNQYWQFDVCDDCLTKWTSTFKHPVSKYGDV